MRGSKNGKGQSIVAFGERERVEVTNEMTYIHMGNGIE